jgi:hypothetical protein
MTKKRNDSEINKSSINQDFYGPINQNFYRYYNKFKIRLYLVTISATFKHIQWNQINQSFFRLNRRKNSISTTIPMYFAQSKLPDSTVGLKNNLCKKKKGWMKKNSSSRKNVKTRRSHPTATKIVPRAMKKSTVQKPMWEDVSE